MHRLVPLLFAVGLAGCEQAVECGEGTERDGDVCVLAEPIPRAPCGQHTVLDPDTDQCVAEFARATCPEFSFCAVGSNGVQVCSCGGDVAQECR